MKKYNQYNLILCHKHHSKDQSRCTGPSGGDWRTLSVILMISRVGSHELSRGRGQHDSWEAVVLVERVQGQCGVAGQGRAVLQAVWVDVGGSSRALRCRYCWVIPRVGPRSVGLQLGIMHQLRGNVCLAGVSQGVLHRPLQLHPPVLEPVSDLREKGNKSLMRLSLCCRINRSN